VIHLIKNEVDTFSIV